MALATRCPACSTVFRISTAQAAAKGGMVRCGHCRNVFNSLDALVRVEDLEIVEEASVDATPAASEAAEIAPIVIGESIARDADVGAASIIGPLPTDAGHDVQPDAPVIHHQRGAGVGHTEVSSVLASLSTPTKQDAGIQEWWMPDPPPLTRNTAAPVIVSAGGTTSAGLVEPSGDRGSGAVTGAGMVGATALGRDIQWNPGVGATGSVFSQPPFSLRTSSTARWTWAFLSLLAALVLSAQIVYRWRDEIAVHWPAARPSLVTICSFLTCKVDYPAHAEAVTIESAGVQTAAAGSNLYVLTALLRNRGETDVRYPHLDLVLTDTNDRPVLRRVLRPEDYLAALREGGERVTPGFTAQSELAVRVTFELNNLRFAGYRLDRFDPRRTNQDFIDAHADLRFPRL